MLIPSVAPRFVQAIFEYLATLGIAKNAVLKEVRRKERPPAAVNGRVSLADYQRLFAASQALTGDAHFGLHMGASPMPQTWGLVSHVVMSAPNPLLAITSLMKYSFLQFDFARFELSASDGEYLVLSWHSNAPRRPSHHVIEHIFANIVALGNSQAGYPAYPVRMEFQHDSMASTATVEKQLTAAIRFNCRADRILVSRQFLELQSPHGHADLFAYTESLAKQRLRELRGADTLVNSIRETILNQLLSGLPKVAATAEALDMSGRTLQRRLQERQLSYQTLLDEVRRELARELVLKPGLSLSDVADYLGFNDQSAFQHAFQRWEGMTPGTFRRAARAASDP